ncbi:MAG: hypothetical protein NZ526_02540 [Aquificaceae bacterium]|nr:hypothetical protein [Aquificaceae bacterium]
MIVLWCDADEYDFEYYKKVESYGIRVIPVKYSLDSREIQYMDNLRSVDAIVISYVNTKVDAFLLEKYKNLKLIVTRSTGCDHIDLTYCKQRGIKVCSLDGYSTVATAEYTVSLILNLLKNHKSILMRVSQGVFQREIHTDLKGKKVGVVGTGRIGSYVSKLLMCFGAEILCWSFTEREDLKKVGAKYVSLQELYKSSDIITFHVRLSEQTKYLFNKDSLNMVKRGVFVVNTSRAGVVEIEAIYEGLRTGIISGCALDCFEEEDYFIRGANYEDANKLRILTEILKHPRVIITPHNAFNSIESKNRDLEYTTETLINYFKNGHCLFEC